MKTLEIFSGAGGLAKGLALAGFQHASFVEINNDACQSLRKNFLPHLVFEGDIANFNFESLEGIDVVAGGPPCQPFSVGGKHLAHEDERDMFPYAVECIRKLKPKFFIFENVKGLMRKSFSDYFEYIILRLKFPRDVILPSENWCSHLARLKSYHESDANYLINCSLINSADYGVPQKRERVIIVGIRSDLNFSWEFPKATHSRERLDWDKHVTGEYWKRHGLSLENMNMDTGKALRRKFGLFPPNELPWQTIRDALLGIPDPREIHGIPDHIYRAGAKIYTGHSGSFLDDPAKTIKAGGHGVPGGENMIRFSDGSVRYFTVHEAKIIQSFPSDYVIHGAWGEAMRQIGNAVPVKLAEIIGRSLIMSSSLTS